MFANSSHFTLGPGNYTHVAGNSVHNHYHINDDCRAWHPTIKASSHGQLIGDVFREEVEDLQIIAKKDLTIICEFGSGPGYFLYAGKHARRAVVVKVFNSGPNARKHLEANVDCVKNLMHPNILGIEGVSSPTSASHFITYQSGNSAVGSLAAALSEDLTKSIILGFKLIAGLSSGLNYLGVQGISPSTIGVQNFDVLVDEEDRFLICYNKNSSSNSAESSSQEPEAEGSWKILNTLCEKLLKDANNTIYDEEIDRSSPTIDSLGQNSDALRPRMTASFSSDHVTNPVEEEEASPELPIVPPRREYVWREVQRGKQSLAQVARRLALDVEKQVSRLKRWEFKDLKSVHRCSGYVREEITLAVTPRDSAILTHDAPSPLEVCSVCNEVVGQDEVFDCVCGDPNPGAKRTSKCGLCNRWCHSICVGASHKDFTCPLCQAPSTTHSDGLPSLNDELNTTTWQSGLLETSSSKQDLANATAMAPSSIGVKAWGEHDVSVESFARRIGAWQGKTWNHSNNVTKLNNWLQSQGETHLLTWTESCQGAYEESVWTMQCKISGVVNGTGVASNKTSAKDKAARMALLASPGSARNEE